MTKHTALIVFALLLPGIVHAASGAIVLEPRPAASLANAPGQSCTELFPDGDFGSVGTSGLGPLQPDPAANPGVILGPALDPAETTYSFATSGTFGCVGKVGCWPIDGEYVILNNNRGMLNPPEDEDGWEYAEDNSPDPDGYWMLVNADETPGLFYKKEVSLIPGMSYEVSADIINICSGQTCEITPNIELVVAPGGTSDEDLVTLPAVAATGSMTSFEWQTYGGTFVPEADESAVIIAFRSIVPGGFGNDFGVDNLSLTVCGDEGPGPGGNAIPIPIPFLSPAALVLLSLLLTLPGLAALGRVRSGAS